MSDFVLRGDSEIHHQDMMDDSPIETSCCECGKTINVSQEQAGKMDIIEPMCLDCVLEVYK